MRKILFGTFILLSLLAQGQNPFTEQQINEIANSGKTHKILSENSTLNIDGYFYYSGILADKLIEKDPENSNYNYRKGLALIKAKHDYKNAIPYFKKAVKNIDKNFDMYGTSEKKAPVDAHFYLGECYHLDKQIDKAIEHYNLFKENSKKRSDLIDLADVKLAQCEVAKSLISNPLNIVVKNIGNVVNTDVPEYSPVTSLDGKTLYFTSRKPWKNNENERYRDPATNQYKEDIYSSFKDGDSWTTPRKLAFCKPLINEATTSLSPDERRVYVYEDTTGGGDLFKADYELNKFSKIKPISKVNSLNTKYWENHVDYNYDEDVMYFVSDRPGGLGGTDIYMMKKKGNSWATPVNLGPNVNGPMNESSPFLTVDDKTLYFATNDTRSMGGFDIMKSELQEDGTWSKAVNVGYPWNSTDDDLFYTTTFDGKTGYFTSFREDGFGEKDIYVLEREDIDVDQIAALRGMVKTKNGDPIPQEFATILKCLDCTGDDADEKITYVRNRDGGFMNKLQPCKTYEITYKDMKNNKVYGKDGFTTLCDVPYSEVYKEIIIDTDKGIVDEEKDPEDKTWPDLEFMHYFAYNKNILSVYKGELNDFVTKIENQMKDGRPSMTVNIFSSASHVPTRTYKTNEKLTKLRAENMKKDLEKFMAEKGISDKVTIVVESAVVQGPKYIKDFKNTEKYFPYQYVGMKTK